MFCKFLAAENKSSVFFIKTFPIKFITPTLYFLSLVINIPCPDPGDPSAKFSGLNNLCSLEMYSGVSPLSQMWFPEVITSTPQEKKESAISLVMPLPSSAAFSPLTTVKSILCSVVIFLKFSSKAFLPVFPITSPRINIFIELSLFPLIYNLTLYLN